MDTMLVWLSDAYTFTDFVYENRPPILKAGDFIVIAKPEGGGGASEDLIKTAKIGVGKLGVFMGAINWRKPWLYVPPDEKKRAARMASLGRK